MYSVLLAFVGANHTIRATAVQYSCFLHCSFLRLRPQAGGSTDHSNVRSAANSADSAASGLKNKQPADVKYDFYLPCMKQPIVREFLTSKKAKPPYLTNAQGGKAQFDEKSDVPLQPTPVKMAKGKVTPNSTPTHSAADNGFIEGQSPKLTPTQTKRKVRRPATIQQHTPT